MLLLQTYGFFQDLHPFKPVFLSLIVALIDSRNLSDKKLVRLKKLFLRFLIKVRIKILANIHFFSRRFV